MIYMVVSRKSRSGAMSEDTACEDHRFVNAIESELKDGDGCTVVKPANIVVTLNVTTESDAMKYARLARNTFQRIDFSSRHDSISIGVLLYHYQEAECTKELLEIAKRMSEIASKTAGSTIECLVLNK